MAQFTAISGRKIPVRCTATGSIYQRHLQDLNKRRNHPDKGDEVQEARSTPHQRAIGFELNTRLLIGTESPSNSDRHTQTECRRYLLRNSKERTHAPGSERCRFQQTPRAQNKLRQARAIVGYFLFPAVQASMQRISQISKPIMKRLRQQNKNRSADSAVLFVSSTECQTALPPLSSRRKPNRQQDHAITQPLPIPSIKLASGGIFIA